MQTYQLVSGLRRLSDLEHEFDTSLTREVSEQVLSSILKI